MKTILIVEDEITIQLGLERILLSIDSNLNIIKTAYAGEALELAQNNIIHAFLLDIQLSDYTGLKLGEQIRKINSYKFTPIIFITAIPSKEIIAYKQFHSYDYIIKPFTDEEIRETMDTVINYYETPIVKESTILRLKHKEISYNYRQKDILYIEARNRKLMISTAKEVAAFSRYTLSSIEKELKDNFLRCHKGFIVNVDYIDKVDKRRLSIYLRNSPDPIPIGRKYIDQLKEVGL